MSLTKSVTTSAAVIGSQQDQYRHIYIQIKKNLIIVQESFVTLINTIDSLTTVVPPKCYG